MLVNTSTSSGLMTAFMGHKEREALILTDQRRTLCSCSSCVGKRSRLAPDDTQGGQEATMGLANTKHPRPLPPLFLLVFQYINTVSIQLGKAINS